NAPHRQASRTGTTTKWGHPAGPSCRKAASASVNQFTHALAKTSVRYREAATDGDIACNRGRGTMPASKKILICAALTTASASRLIVFWGRAHETHRQLETGRVHDRGY